MRFSFYEPDLRHFATSPEPHYENRKMSKKSIYEQKVLHNLIALNVSVFQKWGGRGKFPQKNFQEVLRLQFFALLSRFDHWEIR